MWHWSWVCGPLRQFSRWTACCALCTPIRLQTSVVSYLFCESCISLFCCQVCIGVWDGESTGSCFCSSKPSGEVGGFLFVLVYCNETDTLPLRARVSCCSEYWPLLPPGARGCGTPRLVGCCAVKLDGVDQARVVITDDSLLAVPSRSVRSCFPLTVAGLRAFV